MTKYLTERLAKHHDRSVFDCGVAELNEYLRRRAGQDMRRRIAAVFVLVPRSEPDRIAGYYCLSAASLLLDELPRTIVKKLPRYPSIPAVLIGRLARDVNFPGVGKLLLLDALARSLRHSEDLAAAVVLVDVKDQRAASFYSGYGFTKLSGIGERMLLPMTAVEELLKA